MNQQRPKVEFGKRVAKAPAQPAETPVKRSGQVALLLMGTIAIGGTAYTLMPMADCTPSPAAAIAQPQPGTACRSRSWWSSSGGHWTSRSSFYSGDSAGRAASGGGSETSSGVTRGGFGGFAHAFGGAVSG